MKKLLFLLLIAPLFVQGQIITTFAGGGTGHDGIPATASSIYNPHFVAFDRVGNLFISDFSGDVVRRVDTSGIITTVVGPGTFSVIGDGGPATAAFVRGPEGITCDTFGNLYIADHQNYRIRKVDIVTGIITTIAGTGVPSFTGTGDGGAATAAEFYTPADIKFDKKGNLYISDNSAHTIRKINSSGVITNFAGIGHSPGFSGDGGAATAAQLNNPGAIAIDDTGSVYVADALNKRVRKIDTSGIITTVAGTGIASYSGDGIPATAANVGPLGIAVYNHELYVTDSNQRVRKINTSGIINTIAGTGMTGFSGDGALATVAQISTCGGITVDLCGNIYFSDVTNTRIRKVAFNPTCNSNVLMQNIVPVLVSRREIYPNPAENSLFISSSEIINEIVIVNVLGQKKYLNNSGTNNVQIDVSSFPSGIYFVKINGAEIRRFVKQ